MNKLILILGLCCLVSLSFLNCERKEVENHKFQQLADEFLKGFSTCAIPQHTPDANGHGRGTGIDGLPSQAGQPQPTPASRPAFPATVAGRLIPAANGLGSSSNAARRAFTTRSLRVEITSWSLIVVEQAGIRSPVR